MDPSQITEFLGPGLLGQLVLAGMGMVAALVAGALLLSERGPAAALLPAALALPALSGAAVGLIEGLLFPADPDGMRVALMSTVMARLLVPLLLAPAALTLLGVLAFAGARTAPRSWGTFALALVAVAATCAVTAAGAHHYDTFLYGSVRAAAYALCGGFAATALLAGGPPDGPARRAATGAAFAFPMVVAAGEASQAALVRLVGLLGLLDLEAHKRVATIDTYLDTVGAELSWGIAAVAVASTTTLLGAWAARGTRSAWAAPLWMALAAAVLLAGMCPRAHMVAYAAAL